MLRKVVQVFLVTVLVAMASADYIEDYHRSVEIKCMNPLLNFPDMVYFHNRCKIYDTKVRLEKSPLHKGYGLMANRKLKRGEVVMSEAPTVIFESEVYERLNETEFEKFIIEDSLIYLPRHELVEFLTLADAWTPDAPRIIHIIQSNMFNLDAYLGVFLKTSRINHSCKPNCYYNFYDGVMSIFAARDIEANEELTISYLDDFKPKEERQEHLLNFYGFQCQCELCSRNTSDAREAQREANRAKLGEMFDYDPEEEAPEDNIQYYENMLDLAKQEGLDNDSFIMGEITVNLLNNLMKIPDHSKRYNYSPNNLAEYALGNLSVSYGRKSVLKEYPILSQVFSFLS